MPILQRSPRTLCSLWPTRGFSVLHPWSHIIISTHKSSHHGPVFVFLFLQNQKSWFFQPLKFVLGFLFSLLVEKVPVTLQLLSTNQGYSFSPKPCTGVLVSPLPFIRVVIFSSLFPLIQGFLILPSHTLFVSSFFPLSCLCGNQVVLLFAMLWLLLFSSRL